MSTYPVELYVTDAIQIAGTELVRYIAADMSAGIETPIIAARFHNSVAAAIVAACCRARDFGPKLATVALSGGVFQNVLLTERATKGLEQAGFRVLLHSRVPANDGGISLGQAVVAGARTARR
jgi:hydrogenase maturation protein HypF